LRGGVNRSPVVFLLSTQDEDVGDGFAAESGAAANILRSQGVDLELATSPHSHFG
jgi:hypothetical protein